MTAVALGQAPTIGRARADNKWLVTVAVGFGALMGTIDTSIVVVALPHMRGSLGATLQEITWVSTAYMIAAVLVMPLTGFLGSMFGQKRVYLISLMLFLAGSALCGVATSLSFLVLARVLQGLGAGALQPTQQAILRQTFPPEEQGMAIAMFAMVIMIGPTIGPTLGGWITDNYSWRWIFYVNLPIGLLGLLMVVRFVHEPSDVRRANRARAMAMRKRMDWAGIALMAVGVGSLQYVLEEGPAHDWLQSTSISIFLFVAVVGLMAFVIRELTAEQPAVNLHLFRDRTFAAGTLIGGVMFAMLMGSLFLLPVFMQELLGFDATLSGLTLMPRTLIMMVATPIVGRLYNHVPPAATVGLGVLLFVLGAFDLASRMTLQVSAADLLRPMLITGVGFSCLFVPLTTAALSRIPRPKLADASGLNSFVRQVGGSIGLTVFTSLLTRFTVQTKAAVAQHVTLLRPEVAQQVAAIRAGAMSRGLDPSAASHLTLQVINGRVAAQGATLTFAKVFILQGVAFLVVLPLLFFLRVGRRTKRTAPAPRGT